MIRKIFFWSHLLAGLGVGLFVFILCLTGAIIAFELQIMNYAERDARAHPPTAGMPCKEPAEIIARARTVEKGRIVNMEWFSDPDMPVRVMSDKRSVTLLNGYTGDILSRGAPRLREFLNWVTFLHTDLVESSSANWIPDVANVCLVFLILSGLWIWWPRQWRWKALRSSIAIRFDVKGKARDWNWHNALGFWFLLPLLFISCTGLALSYRSIDQWWRDFGGTKVLNPPAQPLRVAPSPEPARTWSEWQRLITARYPGWRSIMFFGEGRPNKTGNVEIAVNFGTPRQARNQVRLILDLQQGQILQERRWNTGENSNRARSIVRLGHTGEFFGTVGQIIAFLSCLAGLLLVYTGFALSWRRFF